MLSGAGLPEQSDSSLVFSWFGEDYTPFLGKCFFPGEFFSGEESVGRKEALYGENGVASFCLSSSGSIEERLPFSLSAMKKRIDKVA